MQLRKSDARIASGGLNNGLAGAITAIGPSHPKAVRGKGLPKCTTLNPAQSPTPEKGTRLLPGNLKPFL